MKKLRKIAIAMLCVAALGLVWKTIRHKDVPTRVAEIDELLTAYQDVGKFSGSVLIAHHGTILLEKGFGNQNAKTGEKNKAESMFRIYSITKPFTSAMVFKLIDDGKLSLTDRLGKFYPEIEQGDEITIEHLLTHTSGLYEFTREPGFENGEDNLVDLLKERELDFPAGEGWSYCNSGYCLLGHIIARITGKSYEESIEEHIFKPAGMLDSGLDFANLASTRKSQGHTIAFGKDAKLAETVSPEPFAAGAIYSTVSDLLRFQKALASGQIISRESLEKAQSSCSRNRGYGCGWEIKSRFLRSKILSHSGGAAGFRSNFSHRPTDDLCVIVLCNQETDDPRALTDRIYDIWDQKTVALPRETTIDDARLSKLVGFYHVDGKEPMWIRTCSISNRLAVELSGQPINTMLAQENGKFVQPEANATVEFAGEDLGRPNKMSIRLGRRKMTANRTKVVWGLVGTATSNGWDGDDIPFEQAGEDGNWALHNMQLKEGEIIFRLNSDWALHYGDNDNDGLLDRDGNNIYVAAGTYDVLLNTQSGYQPYYELRKVVEETKEE